MTDHDDADLLERFRRRYSGIEREVPDPPRRSPVIASASPRLVHAERVSRGAVFGSAGAIAALLVVVALAAMLVNGGREPRPAGSGPASGGIAPSALPPATLCGALDHATCAEVVSLTREFAPLEFTPDATIVADYYYSCPEDRRCTAGFAAVLVVVDPGWTDAADLPRFFISGTQGPATVGRWSPEAVPDRLAGLLRIVELDGVARRLDLMRACGTAVQRVEGTVTAYQGWVTVAGVFRASSEQVERYLARLGDRAGVIIHPDLTLEPGAIVYLYVLDCDFTSTPGSTGQDAGASRLIVVVTQDGFASVWSVGRKGDFPIEDPAAVVMSPAPVPSCGPFASMAPAPTAPTVELIRPGASGPDQTFLIVYAAASVETFMMFQGPWGAVHPGSMLALKFGPSNELRAEIEQGGAADVFISGDIENAQALVDGCLAPAPVTPFAGNTLAVIVPAGNPAGISSPADLARAGVRVIAAVPDATVSKDATQVVANLAAQPGYPADYARAVAANTVSQEIDAQAVVTRIERGEGDAAIVYATDVVRSELVATIAIPDAANVHVTYAAVRVGASGQPQLAAAFLTFLTGSDAQDELTVNGFLPAP